MHRQGTMTIATLFLMVAKPNLATAAEAPSQKTPPPNIVFILMDDLGWSELGCYGNTFNETPNLDQLAAKGLRFTSAYSAAPVCSPTRAALYTGQYPARVGITDFLRGDDKKYLSPDYHTLPEALQGAGYTTALIGKWHLMGDYRHKKGDPAQHGFDEILCSETKYIAAGDYFAPYFFMPDLKPLHDDEYLTDRLTDEAIGFIRRNRERPFCVFLTHYAIHVVLAANKATKDRFSGKPGAGERGRNPELAAMLVSADEGVGRIVSALRDLGLEDRTLVVFTSDNGGDRQVTTNAPLRAGKSTLYEGGIRVPLIVCGAGVDRRGETCDVPVSTVDFYPTFLESAGAKPQSGQILDGESLVPLLKRDSTLKRDTLYWHFPLEEPLKRRPVSAIRQGRFKLIEFLDRPERQLFDLQKDVSESHDLAQEMPDKVTELAGLLETGLESLATSRTAAPAGK